MTCDEYNNALSFIEQAEQAYQEWRDGLDAAMREIVIRKYLSMPVHVSYACGCMGPQDDEPVCPCAMQRVVTVDVIGGKRYFEVSEERKELNIEFKITEIFGKIKNVFY